MPITAKGRALRERADPLSLELEALILSRLSVAEPQDFRRILDKLSAWLHSEFEQELAARYPEAGEARSKRR